jgi:hypothetical protein
MSESTKIPAVFKEDVQNLLQSLNELDPISQGNRICKVCSKIITPDNIQIIIPRQNSTYEYICDSPVCIEEYNRKKEKKHE